MSSWMRGWLIRIRAAGLVTRLWAAPVGGRRLACLAACALACVGVALACGWSGPANSVRFSGWGEPNEYAYSRLPPLSLDGERPGEGTSADDEDYEGYAERERRKRAADSAWAVATRPDALADRASVERTRASLRTYLDGPDGLGEWRHVAFEIRQRRNTAIDLLDAFTALDAGSPPAALQSYAHARAAYDAFVAAAAPPPFHYSPPPTPTPRSESAAAAERDSLARAARRAVEEIPADRNLSDNADYLRAAILYRERKYEEAARAFESLASRAPRSEKRDAALLMAGLAHMKRSRSYAEDDATALSSDPCPGCRDEAWSRARSAFARLLAEYPRGRFGTEARGRLAFLSLRVGDTGAGLADYYRMLADDTDEVARAEALVSLRLARRRTDSEAMRRVEAELADEPRPALLYAYHSIYNYAQSFSSYDLPPALEKDEDDGDEPEYGSSAYLERGRRTQQRLEEFQRAELRRVADFAAAMLRRYPRAEVGAGFSLRLAEAHFELDEPRPALASAARALAAGLRGEQRAEALWVKGVSEYRLKDFGAARRTLAALVSENPKGRLEPGARRLVAMIAEDAGDLGGALEQYLALGYREDAGYLLDVLMTPEQLASFVEARPGHEKIDELYYALGVRYLRDGRHAEARAAYARVRTSGEGNYQYWWTGGDDCERNAWSRGDYNPYCDGPKDVPRGYEGGVPARWVLRDLQTINDLEGFDRTLDAARDEEARAEALYQKASYLYESDLLFYNPAAWHGIRHRLLPDLDGGDRFRAPGEAQLLFQHARRHEMAARALDIYLEVVRRFPETRAARDALYTAAVCHNRLANYNNYWRGKYASGLHAGDRLVTFADVRATYPRYRFPVGSDFGWEPSTRTVGGRAAWPAPPKPQPPKPRPTRAQRVKRLALAYCPALANFAARAWHWLTVSLVLAGCLLSARVAARARRQWRAQLARRGAKTKTAGETLRELWAATRGALFAAGGGPSCGGGGDPLAAGDGDPLAAGDGRPPETAAPVAPWLLYAPQPTWLELRVHKYLHASEMILRATSRALWHYVSPLTHDTHGRQALATNAVAHALLFALLTTLVRLLYAG